MWRILWGVTLFTFILGGCQSNDIEEVVNKHNDIKNLDVLNTFVENVNDQRDAVINYVEYGEEGQRGVKTITSKDGIVKVSHRVDGKFIEEFTCKKLNIEMKNEVNSYLLKQCYGDFEGDIELLSTKNLDE